MVHQEECRASWFWPLGRRAAGQEQCKEACSARGDSENDEDHEYERAFVLANTLEQGFAREVATDLLQPLRRSNRLYQFHVIRSADLLQYRFCSDDGHFLMHACLLPDARRVDFHLYNPCDRDTSTSHFDPSRPAFTMTWNEAKTEWMLVQEKCECCQFSPKHSSCSRCGKQQVAFIRHSRIVIGEGSFNRMEINIPGLYSDDQRVIWCPKLGRGDLSLDPLDDSHESLRLITKRPEWNSQVQSLVLDFKGRRIAASAKNFQLIVEQGTDRVVCQYAKIGSNTFCLDFRYPLSAVQAFASALTTAFWV